MNAAETPDAEGCAGERVRPVPEWHAMSVHEVVELLQTDRAIGLSEDTAKQRAEHSGLNVLREPAAEPMWRRLVRQFQELVIQILLLAALLAALMSEYLNSAAILGIVVLNGLLGFLQEESAQRALLALKKLSLPMARVYRDGRLQSLPAAVLVPGDLLELEAGEHIPADCRLLQTHGLMLQESALTGEATTVEKNASAILLPEVALAERQTMVYLGTTVVSGRGQGVVVTTGMQTELGRIANLLQTAVTELTPLQKQLAALGRILSLACLGPVLLMFSVHMLRGADLLQTVMLSVSLAVAAVPEGLPAVVTLTLALGVHRMVRRHVLIRRLPGAETLGAVTVICSDKTGTLTRNEMTVRVLITADAQFTVTGSGYIPRGEILKHGVEQETDGELGQRVQPAQEPDLKLLLQTGVYCNNAVLSATGDFGETWQVIGDPTEGALLIAAMKAGLYSHPGPGRRLLEIPFDSERKIMSVVQQDMAGEVVMYTKGAPEIVLGLSSGETRNGQLYPLTERRRAEILGHNERLAAKACRVLGLAVRRLPVEANDPQLRTAQEADLVFLGLVGMIDPPREEAAGSIHACHRAGIRVLMITGDQPRTALAVARELGIADEAASVITGSRLDSLSDEQLRQAIRDCTVYARVSAEHKLRLVRALKANGEVVAMTGDGVNDAPALQAADIGIAMGLKGTDVSREAADMVLMDDNFASIVNAVEEGRGIFENIRRSVHFLLSGNSSELLLMLFAACFGWPPPLAALQILWINLITDGLPALALGMETPGKDLMRRAPHRSDERVLYGRLALSVLLYGLLLASVTAVGFRWVYVGEGRPLKAAQTVAFAICSFSQLLMALSCRSLNFGIVGREFFGNKWLLISIVASGLLQFGLMQSAVGMRVLQLEPMTTGEWWLTGALALIPVTIMELLKSYRRLVKAWSGTVE